MGQKADTPALKRAGEKLLQERIEKELPKRQLNLFPNYEALHNTKPAQTDTQVVRKEDGNAIDDKAK